MKTNISQLIKSLPSKNDALRAVNTLLEYIGVDTQNEHFKDTPRRVVNSFEEIYGGYKILASDVLKSKVYKRNNYDQPILLKDIEFTSTCAHHMLPIVGTVSVSYIPGEAIVGISKIARVVDVFAKRLQIQENMTVEIAEHITRGLKAKGVAVRIAAEHYCMISRGVKRKGSILDTYHFTGLYADNPTIQTNFIHAAR